MALIDKLTAIADAIRAKTGKAGALTLDEMVTEIAAIEGGGSGGDVVDDGTLKAVIERTVVNLTLPSDLTSIGTSAFNDCANLALTSLPDGVTSIGGAAFSGCTNLALTSLPDGVTSIGGSAFNRCTNLALTSLPVGVTSIGSHTFNSCTNLALTSLPDGVTSIGEYAFFQCSNLALTSLPEGLTTIGSTAFNGCTGLTLMTLPESLKSVGTGAFQSCSNLRRVVFKGTPTTFGVSRFTACSKLVTIIAPWSEGTFASAPWGATNATVYYDWTSIFEDTVTVGAYDEDLDGHAGTYTGDFDVEIEDGATYRVLINDVEYVGTAWVDENVAWGIEVDGVDDGAAIVAIAYDSEVEENGGRICNYYYNEVPESTDSLPESITLEIFISKAIAS